MGKITLYTFLCFTGATALVRPWIGVVAAYLIIILEPQRIWWWNFEGLRPVYWIILPTCIGFGIAFLRKEYDLKIVKNQRNLYIFILWVFFIISYYFGAYVNVSSASRFQSVDYIFNIMNKIFVLYFIGAICIDSEKKLKCLALILIFSIIYMIYWANYQYLSGYYGRMRGPAGQDQNGFAMLLTTGLPFLYYFGLYFKNRILRYGIWLVIPFGWHAIFLTGSRSGLLALTITIIIITFLSPKKKIGVLLISAFIIAYIWQAGSLMKTRTGTILEYQTEGSAKARLEAWDAAINMIISYPLTGVGLGSFVPAFQYHSDKTPREAHNTFFQIAAEAGLIAGFMYLLTVSFNFILLWKNVKFLKNIKSNEENNCLLLVNYSILASFSGLIVCSMFVSLQYFEIFYYSYVIINTVSYLSQKLRGSIK